MTQTKLGLGFLVGVIALVFGVLHQGEAGWMSAVPGGFHPGHVWALDHVGQQLGALQLPLYTEQIGFPEVVNLRFIAWVPLLIGGPLSLVLGPILAYNLVLFGSIVASAVLMGALIRRVVGTGWATAGGSALVYALGPYALGCLANGQLAKLQLWCMPLCLLMLDRLFAEGRSVRRCVGLFIAVLLTGFSAPSIALVLPVAAVIWWVFRRPSGAKAGLGLGALGALLLGLGLLGPWAYHSFSAVGIDALVPAAPIPGLVQPLWLAGSARLDTLLWGTGPWDGAPDAINNVGALGLPALIAVLVLGFRRRPGWGLGLGLAAAGAVLSLGPELNAMGLRWVMPAWLLDAAGYPLAKSGMYYRFAQLGALGLSLGVAHGVAQYTSPRNRIAAAWIVGLLVIADGVRGTSVLWPRSLQAIDGIELLESVRADPAPGAVLDLPLAHLDTGGERRLLAATVHRRPTTALARNTVVHGDARLSRLQAMVLNDAPRQALVAAGFSHVLVHSRNTPGARQLIERLSRTLGPPQTAPGLALWRVAE